MYQTSMFQGSLFDTDDEERPPVGPTIEPAVESSLDPSPAPEPSDAETPFLVLGLDPGIGSCGFCLIDLANHRILEMGSHLFDIPQESKTKVSLAKGRRDARSMRRNIKRTRDRLTHVLEALQEEGIVDAGAQKSWFQPRKGEAQLLDLRKKGLDKLLSDREWARVLYSLCVRRGYIPHGEGDVEDADASSDDGKVLAAIKVNTARMKEGGWRTVGEMMAESGVSRNKGGEYGLCVTNKQIVDEVHQLFAAQRAHGSEHASEEFEADYIARMTWQKQTKDYDKRVYELVGKCTYFPDEYRAASADLTSEMLRAQERFAHIRFVDASGNERTIPCWRRQQFVDDLFLPL